LKKTFQHKERPRKSSAFAASFIFAALIKAEWVLRLPSKSMPLPDGFSLEACGEPGFGTTRREESIDARFLRGHYHCGGGGLVGFNGDTVVKEMITTDSGRIKCFLWRSKA
jgi:hypothetical protein